MYNMMVMNESDAFHDLSHECCTRLLGEDKLVLDDPVEELTTANATISI